MDSGAASAAASRQPSVPPAAQRRLVSVMFADLVGFTSLSDSRDPEDVRDLLSRYFDVAREIVARYGGTVDKFIGDAVVAVWGTPAAHEDDAERAVRAGLDLTDAVAVLGKELGGPALALRAAVGTGQAGVVVGAAGQGMVAGDLVNTTSRLQAAAPPGGLLADEGTQRAAGRAILFEALGDQVLKGKALPVLAWRALRVVAARRGTGRSERLEAPFVGREEELRLLKDLFHATARERRARLISIIGQAGIGKSRLAWEFEKYIDGLAQDIYWHQGRSPAYGEGITFWALGEMLRRRAGIAETDDAALTAERLAATLADYVPDESERRWLRPHLASLLGVGDAPAAADEQLFAAWRTFFERVAERGPTVMVFEDLHWADQGQLDFIEHLLQWSRAQPILIITLSRPELRERRPTWGVDQRNFTGLHLERLPDEAISHLLIGLVPGLPDPVVGVIVRRAEGIPLYAVETVRMLQDDGRLVAHDGSYQVVGELTQLAVPATLHALINARLDGLPVEERQLVQDAAVLGQFFTLAALAALRDEPPERLEPRLRSLVRKEVLVHDVDARSPERGQYGFVQAVIREVAHDTIPKRERRDRHLAVARYFEALGEHELSGMVASHYLAAYRATPEGEEALVLKGKARDSLRAAAERAAALHSYDQALAYLEQALAVTDDPAEQAALWEFAATAALSAARYEVAATYLRSAIAWVRRTGDRAAMGRLMAALGRCLSSSARPEQAIAELEAAREELAGLESGQEFAELTAQLARAYFLHGESRRAIEWSEAALAAAGPLDLVPVIVDALITKGSAIGDVGGRYREGMAEMMGALALAQAHGLIASEFRARNNIAAWHLIDDHRVRLAIARDGLERARKHGKREWAITLANQAIDAALHTGDWDWALSTLAEFDQDDVPLQSRLALVFSGAVIKAHRGSPETGMERLGDIDQLVASWTNPQWASLLPAVRGEIAVAAGDLEESYQQAMRGLKVARGDTIASILLYVDAGRAALWLPNRDRAGLALKALDAIPVPGAWVNAARRTLRAGVAALDGRMNEAIEGYADAARLWRELELPFDLGLCQLEFVMLVEPGHPQTVAAADEAREIFERLKAPGLLARLLAARPVAGELVSR